jgi:hypothetical protein
MVYLLIFYGKLCNICSTLIGVCSIFHSCWRKSDTQTKRNQFKSYVPVDWSQLHEFFFHIKANRLIHEVCHFFCTYCLSLCYKEPGIQRYQLKVLCPSNWNQLNQILFSHSTLWRPKYSYMLCIVFCIFFYLVSFHAT